MNLQTLTQGNIWAMFTHKLPLHLPNFPDAACGPQKETIFSYVAVNIDFPHAEVVERANRDAPFKRSACRKKQDMLVVILVTSHQRCFNVQACTFLFLAR